MGDQSVLFPADVYKGQNNEQTYLRKEYTKYTPAKAEERGNRDEYADDCYQEPSVILSYTDAVVSYPASCYHQYDSKIHYPPGMAFL